MMNKILFFLLGLILSINAFAVSESELRVIYKNILTSNNLKELKLHVVNDPRVYAESDYFNIYMNNEEIKLWSKDQAAFILGHELGHSRMRQGAPHDIEYSADKYGCIYLQNAGYNVHKGISIMKTWPEIISETHPLPSERLRKLGG
jgi:hypothetical protein